MKTALKTMLIGVAACAFAGPASAYTLSGTVPTNNQPAVINLQKPMPTNYSFVRFTVTLPQRWSNGVRYGGVFCIGPPGNPCPLPINVPGGQQIVVIFSPATIADYTLSVSQPTNRIVPYTIKVEYFTP